MAAEPWKKWIPGVLSKIQTKELLDEGYIRSVDDPDSAIGHSAIDLTLSSEAYCMNEGSIKPDGVHYFHELNRHDLVEKLEPDEEGAFVLERSKTYLFKLKENLQIPKEASIYGQATAKSTIGRMDVLARLIVDGMDEYEGFNPKALDDGNGEMYLEITPMTFNVRVKEGIQLSQLRLFRGRPEVSEIRGSEVYEPLLHSEDGEEMDGSLSVDLNPEDDFNAFCAKRMEPTDSPLDLWEREVYDPSNYWERLKCDRNKRLKINKTNFYILKSKEVISLPESVAIYCRAIDEAIGEMRIHYAGFAHPFFGMGRKDGKPGTSLVFEVRGHDVDVSLKDGEKMAKLIFYRLSKNSTSDGNESYNDQRLQLSKVFDKWPDNNIKGDEPITKPA